MGFTHYTNRPKTLTLKTFTAAAADCRTVVEALRVPVQLEYDNPAPPVFTKDEVAFNGVGDDGHETFAIDRVFIPGYTGQKPDKDGWGDFCKTARKPYDVAVCACLVVFKHHFGDKFVVSSDGEDDEAGWPVAREACQRLLGYGADFSLNTPRRLGSRGLGLGKGTGRDEGGFRYRPFDNGWDLCKPTARWSYQGWGPHAYKVLEGGLGRERAVCSANTVARARWLATCHHIARVLNESPDNPFVRSALKGATGEWIPFLTLADSLGDACDPRERLLRALLPQCRVPV